MQNTSPYRQNTSSPIIHNTVRTNPPHPPKISDATLSLFKSMNTSTQQIPNFLTSNLENRIKKIDTEEKNLKSQDFFDTVAALSLIGGLAGGLASLHCFGLNPVAAVIAMSTSSIFCATIGAGILGHLHQKNINSILKEKICISREINEAIDFIAKGDEDLIVTLLKSEIEALEFHQEDTKENTDRNQQLAIALQELETTIKYYKSNLL